VSKSDQYARQAAGWSTTEYADSRAYLEHRARLVARLGPPLRDGDDVLDLACGDGGLGLHLRSLGLRYRGVDATPEMVAEARRRLGDAAAAELGDLNEYVPAGPVAATTMFRALYYVRDRPAFFRQVAGWTRTKLVFDLNPRQYRLEEVAEELVAAGFGRPVVRPFFVPQRYSLPRPVAGALRGLERSGPPARLLLRFRFTYLLAAPVAASS
jgi:SAM-dependent methyltransferase